MFGGMTKAIDALLDEARRIQGQGDGGRYASVDLDDDELRAKLRAIAMVRAPTLEDLDRAVEQLDAEFRARMVRLGELNKKCSERRDDLKVFFVTNTAGKRLTVLACDLQCARHFAYYHGHIKDERNGRVTVMKPDREADLRKSGKALGRALRDGWPGVVTQLGDNVVMEGSKKVYTPMTIVE